MHAVLLGASRGVGYHTLLHLLQNQETKWTTTLLLRKPDGLKNDLKLQEYISEGRITFVEGNATSEDDVRKLFGQRVDLVVTSVGAAPVIGFTGISIDQPDLCMKSTIALLHVLASLPPSTHLPRVVAVSSMGIGENHHVLPWSMQLFYSWALARPHLDKEALEVLLQRSSSILPTPSKPEPSSLLSSFLPASSIDSVKENFLPEIIIVRGAFYVGGDSPPKGRENTRVGEEVQGLYTVRRSELGRFIAEDCVPGNDEWVNKLPMVGY